MQKAQPRDIGALALVVALFVVLFVLSVTLGAPRLGLAFRYALSERVAFQQEAELLPNVFGDSRLLANSTSKLSAGLTESLALTSSLLVNYDSAPAAGKRPTDTALSVGVELGL